MFKKSLFALVLVVAVMLTAAACGGDGTEEGNGGLSGAVDNVTNAVSDAVGQYITGNVTGQVGKKYSTEWFDFTVHSIEAVDEYAGYIAQDGYQLYDVLITETSTYEYEPLPMGTYDFIMDEDTWEEYVWPMDPLEGRDEMMPAEFELAYGETVEYHLLFEVPKTESGLNWVYREIDTDGNIGVIFTININ